MPNYFLPVLIALLFLSSCGEEEVRPLEDDENVQIVRLRAVGDEMLFDKDEIRVTHNQPVRIILINEATMDVMKHNVLIVNEGASQDVGMAAIAEAENDYIPDVPEVLFASALAEPGETIEFEFMPPEPGTYEFVCTYPGHFTTMRGLFIVEEEPEAS